MSNVLVNINLVLMFVLVKGACEYEYFQIFYTINNLLLLILVNTDFVNLFLPSIERTIHIWPSRLEGLFHNW